MATSSTATSSKRSEAATALNATDWNERASSGSFVTLAGRILFFAIFVMSGFMHSSQQEIAYAAKVGVPMARLLVPASGILALTGGLSILLGYRAKTGAWLLVLFLVPVTLVMHNFWAAGESMRSQMQMAMFLKNVTMVGGALLISQFGVGTLTLDARRDSAR